jgi:hypothetical protein
MAISSPSQAHAPTIAAADSRYDPSASSIRWGPTSRGYDPPAYRDAHPLPSLHARRRATAALDKTINMRHCRMRLVSKAVASYFRRNPML